MEKSKQGYLSDLLEIDEAIHATLNLQRILDHIVMNITTVLGVKGCSISLMEEDGVALKARANYGLSRSFLAHVPGHADSIISESLEGKNVFVEDALNDPRIHYQEALRDEGISSILSLPISARGKVIGVEQIYVSAGYQSLKERIDLVKAFSVQCALVIDNACLYEKAEDRHEIIMPDVWKWFRVTSLFHSSKVIAPPPQLGKP